eukprot:767291-Hanusia_phi.AAC.2
MLGWVLKKFQVVLPARIFQAGWVKVWEERGGRVGSSERNEGVHVQRVGGYVCGVGGVRDERGQRNGLGGRGGMGEEERRRRGEEEKRRGKFME